MKTAKGGRRRLRGPGLIIAGAVLALVLHAGLWTGCFSTDDAFISYRYAENAAGGRGLVWNPGERVEGYTNFLWTVLLAALARLGADLPRAAPWLGIGLAALSLPVAAALARRAGAGDLAPAAAWLLALSGPFALWAGAGLETALFALLLAAASLLLAGRAPGSLAAAGALYGLAALTRPEGLLFGVVALLVSLPGRPRGALAGLGLLAAMAASQLAWRLAYYGDFLPNTYYAKSAGDPAAGLRYLGGLLGLSWPLYLLAAFGIARRRLGWLVAALAPIPLYLAYLVRIGGDWMPSFRLAAPLLPLLAAAAAATLASLAGRRRRLAALAAALAWTGALAAAALAPELARPPAPDVLRELGLHLARQADPGAVVAVVPAGKVPYYSRLRAIDMRGLCDRHIARLPAPPGASLPGHAKRDPDYVLARRPDYIVTTGAARKRGLPAPPLEGGPTLDSYPILTRPEFRAHYEPVRVELPEGTKDLMFFRRR